MSVSIEAPRDSDAGTAGDTGPGAPSVTPAPSAADGPTAPGGAGEATTATTATTVTTGSPVETARRQATWLLGAKARTVLLVVLAAMVAVLLVAPPKGAAARDFSVTAASISTAMAGQTGVSATSGGYLPGTGIVLVSSVAGVTSTQLNGILAASLGPVAAQLADLPDGEAVSWQATLAGADGAATVWLIRVAADAVDDQSQWVAVPVGAGTAVTAAPAGAAGAPTAATTASAVTSAVTSAATSAGGSAPATAAPSTTSAAVTTGAPAGSAPATTAETAAGTGDPATTAAAAGPTGPQSDDFAGDAAAWKTLTGTWAIVDGTYQQTDASGYDYISQFTSTLPSSYTVSVKMKGLADTVNGGLIIGQPALGSRKGATIVDLASKDYVRWGSYDAGSSTYKFTGGAALGAAQNAADWHTLSITVKADATVVSWDGKQVGTFAAVAAGTAGLVSSQSAVAFDDFTVTAS